jgi:hypothetical protein
MCYMRVDWGRVGVRELRQNLSVYLRRVLKGESFEVTDRGRTVAVLARSCFGSGGTDIRCSSSEGETFSSAE